MQAREIHSSFVKSCLTHENPTTGYKNLYDFFDSRLKTPRLETPEDLVSAARFLASNVHRHPSNVYPPKGRVFIPQTVWQTILIKLSELDYSRNPQLIKPVLKVANVVASDRGECVIDRLSGVYASVSASKKLGAVQRKKIISQIDYLLSKEKTPRKIYPATAFALREIRDALKPNPFD